MNRIAIVDDDIYFLDIINKKLENLRDDLEVFCYNNPNDFIENIDNFDYVLLDIDLPQVDGITISKRLRNNDISIFFLTIHEECMIKAFGRNVEGFILKNNLDVGINDFLHFISNENNEQLIINLYNQEMKIHLNDILLIHYSLRDLEFYLVNNKKIIEKNKNLKDIVCLLNNKFIQINRNDIINLDYVENYKDGYVYIRKNKLKVSRRKTKSLKIRLIERKIS